MALNAKLTSAEANIGLYLSGVSERPLPGIVLLHEIFGVNHAMEIAADGFARAGFVVAAPDLYHAFAPGTALSYQAVDRPRAVKLKSKLRETEAVNDIAVVHHWLKRQPLQRQSRAAWVLPRRQAGGPDRRCRCAGLHRRVLPGSP